MKIFGYEIKKPVNVDTSTTHHRRSPEDPKGERQKYEVYNDLVSLRDALDVANVKGMYDRQELHTIYTQAMRDTHIYSQWNSRKMKTQLRKFELKTKVTEEYSDKTTLLNAGWFRRFISECMDSKMWGFSLVQFGTWKDNKFNSFFMDGEIKDAVYSIDRDYVFPEFGTVAYDRTPENGVSFYTPKFWVIPVGDSHNLGMLEKLAALYLIKKNATENWSEWAEIFGMNMRVVKTESTGEARNKLIEMLKNMGSNGIGVLGMDDQIEFPGTSHSDAYKVYENLMRYVDEQISKIIFGQDVVSNNTGQVVGKTGENIAKMYGNADAVFIENIVNDELLPFMSRVTGVNFDDVYFQWEDREELSLIEKAEIDLKISQMGFAHSEEYINETYNVEAVSSGGMEKENALSQEKILNRIKEIYVPKD